MHYFFDMSIARVYGVDVAIFLQNIAYWIKANKANKKNFHESRYWTYNTLDAFVEIFPCWSRRQIERIIKHCIDHNLIIKGNHNEKKYDRKCWYALTDDGLKLFNMDDSPISPNGEMDFTKRGNGYHQTVTPIADSKHRYKTTHKKEREAAQKTLAPLPLSDDFLPNEEVKLIAKQRGVDLNASFEVFKIKKKDRKSKDWHDELKVWVLNERVVAKSAPATSPKNEVRSTVPEYERDSDFKPTKPEIAKKHLGSIINKLKGVQGSSHDDRSGLPTRN